VSKVKQLDCICFGTITLDYRKELTGNRDIPSEPLQLTDEPINFRIGGISILATALTCMGFNTAVAGQAGKDIAGYGLKAYLREKYNINTECLKLTDNATSYSIIHLSPEERYIQHNIGANAFLEPDKDFMAFLKKNKPVLVAIGYSGLLPELDHDHGTKMAELITALKSEGIMTILDTHTMNDDYSMLDKPLKCADIFFCNAEEGSRISGRKNPESMLQHITRAYSANNGKQYRIFGITLPNGVYIAYGRNVSWDKGFVESAWYTENPKDLTGAGDAFRAGFCAHLISNATSFKKGTFDWRKAGMLGNLIAAVMITEGYGGIKNYGSMLARSLLS